MGTHDRNRPETGANYGTSRRMTTWWGRKAPPNHRAPARPVRRGKVFGHHTFVTLARARASGVRMLAQFADTLETYQEGILAYYDYPISTGPLEGTNTKIQAMKRQAYGFRDRAFFKLKILGIHETKHALVG